MKSLDLSKWSMNNYPNWFGITQSSIVATSALLGVLIGGLITGYNQKKERRNNRRREQLMEFYAPLRGIRAEIRAKSELRAKLSNAAAKMWQAKFAGIDDPEKKKKLEEEQWPKYEKLLQYNAQQLREELIPLYQKMLDHFTTNMGSSEPSTLEHYPALIEFVEIWNRWLKDAIPDEVVNQIDHSETMLTAFYADIEAHFRQLKEQLKE